MGGFAKIKVVVDPKLVGPQKSSSGKKFQKSWPCKRSPPPNKKGAQRLLSGNVGPRITKGPIITAGIISHRVVETQLSRAEKKERKGEPTVPEGGGWRP